MLHAVVPFKSGLKSVTGITEPAQSEQHPFRQESSEQMRPGHCIESVLCDSFAFTLLVG